MSHIKNNIIQLHKSINIEQDHFIKLIQALITNSYPTKYSALLEFKIEVQDQLTPNQLHELDKVLLEYKIKSDAQRQSGKDHAKTITKKTFEKKYPTPFTTPSFKVDYRGKGTCGCCGQMVNAGGPGPAFFLNKDNDWKIWHALPSCFPNEFESKMKANKKWIAWSEPKK